MPSLGADMESAILMEWLVKEGDQVSKGQVIAEVETSKGVIEIEIFEDGVVEKLLVEEETDCKVGTPLALIRSDGEKVEEVAKVEEVTKVDEVVKEEVQEVSKETKREEEKEVPKEQEVPKESTPQKETIEPSLENATPERLKVSPAARKKADELGVDLTKIEPKDGVIRLAQLVAKEAQTISKAQIKPENTAKDAMRKAIAAAMSRSNAEIPHYYLSASINMSPALAFLEELNESRDIKSRILPVAMLIRAVALSLQKVPELNGFYKDGVHEMREEVHIGVAIALRKGGLMTPALLNAQSLNLGETMSALSDLITRTRGGKLRSSEISEQTITLTNLGDLGVESVYGVIYPPQLAIVGLGAILDSPWVEANAIGVRKVMKATLAGDHRATDGRTGALFLGILNKFLQNPKELL